MTTNDNYKQSRILGLKTNNITPYPHIYTPNIKISEYVEQFSSIESGELHRDKVFSIGGRVQAVRTSGKNLRFYQIINDGNELQIIVIRQNYTSDNFDCVTNVINRGDIIGIEGFVCKSKTGELSLMATNIVLITPCYRLLPTSQTGLVNQETRERQRYLDLIVNYKNLSVFKTRHNIINIIRSFLNNMDFYEVQTPSLHSVAGGASAKPFATFHNDTNQDMYLRIAPELYLKQYVVGGLDRVYEIGSQFRNESADRSHNPEFTSLEFYMAYADVNTMISICEGMLSAVVTGVNGASRVVKYGTSDIDFTTPFKQIDIMDELKANGIVIDFDLMSDEVEFTKYLNTVCKDNDILCENPRTINRMMDKIIGHFIEPQCINPTFVMNHPLSMSPLAKKHRSRPGLSERFELFVNGFELCNAYSELNDPDEQYGRFMSQMKDKDSGDGEAQCLDAAFIEALNYGLPCTGGFGCGIDRLVMILTNANTIRDVIAFPLNNKLV